MNSDPSLALKVTLRPATPDDAQFLFECRNDPETRANSIQTDPVTWDGHLSWLDASFGNPERKLFIAEMQGNRVGTGRGDRSASGWELSWTISPDNRGVGIGSKLVAALMDEFDGPVSARVRAGNLASIRISERCGMVRGEAEGEIIVFSRP